MSTRTRNFILILGDLATLYLALGLVLQLRGLWSDGALYLQAFTALNLVWIAVFYINDLYGYRFAARLGSEFLKAFLRAMIVNVVIAVAAFYFLSFYGITPKTNLALYLLVFVALFLIWRTLAGRKLLLARKLSPTLLVDLEGLTEKLRLELSHHPILGYRVIESLGATVTSSHLEAVVARHSIKTVIVSSRCFRERSVDWYGCLAEGIEVTDLPTFWEELRQEILIDRTEPAWFLENLRDLKKHEYEAIKRAFDIVSALILGVILAPLALIAAVIIKLTSPGPIIYRQRRVGRNGREFTLYKFRTMLLNAEADGPRWSTMADERVTAVGRWLRHTHFDEYPQLWNILRGELSLVGPRPERPEFVAELEAQIPHYKLRQLAKPGLTGWAQVNYRYGASTEDTARKLAYDLYYLKHRSSFLDFKILLKTAASVWKGEGR